MQPARTRLQVDVRRQQLLELGLELFANRTYDELSIDEIAKQAGISKGLLYHYFPSKRAFYVAAVREAARELLAETDIDQHGMGAEPDPEGVRAGVRAFLDWAESQALDLESFIQLLVQMTSLVFAAVLHPPER